MLNQNQKRAVEATEGRVLILAGAGSGKTSVLAHRIAHLVAKGIEPGAILGLTFTNKAAGEMRERVAGLIGPAAKKVTLSTFHSFCCKILRKEIHHLGYTAQFSLYDEKDVKRLMTQMARQVLEHDGDLPSLEPTMAKIAYAKSRGVGIEVSEKASWHDKFAHDLFGRLHTCMRAYNAVDFDSLLSLTVQLFEEHPQVLEKYQERYRYIMIDEYQDTNPVQYKLAKLLAGKYDNLCVVGDDDQSIYGWRGAEIKNILKFESKTIIKLEQNYRSTPVILKAANAVICHNKERHAKELWSSKESGEPIILFHAPSDIDEATTIANRLIWLHKHKNLAWRDMAILYRSNVLSRQIEVLLLQRGIPYEIFGGTEFYERAEVKDLMAYLKVLENPRDQEALLRIINVPRRGISDQTLDILTQINRSNGLLLWEVLEKSSELAPQLNDKAHKNIQAFLTLIARAKTKFNERPISTAFSWLLEEINYKKAITEEVKSEKMREFKWENVAFCVDTMKRLEEERPDISLQEFLEETHLDENSPHHKKKTHEDKVSLMTFHGAKGLEFEACFLVGLEDHIIPHEKSMKETGLEEERRLMYVAMTRAKKHLILSMARQRKKMGKDIACTPSRFLFEIPTELLKITSWKEI